MYLLILVHSVGDRIRSLTDFRGLTSRSKPFPGTLEVSSWNPFWWFPGMGVGVESIPYSSPPQFTCTREDQVLSYLISKHPRAILNLWVWACVSAQWHVCWIYCSIVMTCPAASCILIAQVTGDCQLKHISCVYILHWNVLGWDTEISSAWTVNYKELVSRKACRVRFWMLRYVKFFSKLSCCCSSLSQLS